MLPNLHSLRLFMLDWRKEETYGTHPWGINADPTKVPPPIRPLLVSAISVVYTSRALETFPGENDDLRRIDVLRYFSDMKLLRISRASPTSDIPEMHPLNVEKLLLYYIADAPGWITLLKRANITDTLRSFGTGVLALYSPALERTPIAIWLHEDVGPRLEELDLSIVKVYAHTAQSVMSRSWENLGLSTCINLVLSPSLFPYLRCELMARQRGTSFFTFYPTCRARTWKHFTSHSKAKNLMSFLLETLLRSSKHTIGNTFHDYDTVQALTAAYTVIKTSRFLLACTSS
ncbi:hypothetical protein QCA50_004765 [Cerrena zonata]|uniref:Uncharacterized protein n=1 Tax=Cerrena zonata TaxID=2478898 RepID=A0AAW0GHT1_9APHY